MTIKSVHIILTMNLHEQKTSNTHIQENNKMLC